MVCIIIKFHTLLLEPGFECKMLIYKREGCSRTIFSIIKMQYNAEFTNETYFAFLKHLFLDILKFWNYFIII